MSLFWWNIFGGRWLSEKIVNSTRIILLCNFIVLFPQAYEVSWIEFLNFLVNASQFTGFVSDKIPRKCVNMIISHFNTEFKPVFMLKFVWHLMHQPNAKFSSDYCVLMSVLIEQIFHINSTIFYRVKFKTIVSYA